MTKPRSTLVSKVVPLHLIFDYPVYWSKFKVLRDLLQNFYDAVGHREWHQRFSWQCAKGCLQLNAQGVGFSYDWLLHIGASTKREAKGEYAGYFGEGFKIAALCALRDYHWQIELASREWRLHVTTDRVRVDGRDLDSLAYRIWHNEPERDDTVIWIKPFSESDREIAECAFLSFYAETNPLFSEKIWSSSEGGVFLRSKHPKPAGFPKTDAASGSGIVFAGYQALGSIELPLVVCSHRTGWNDRDRSNFFRMDVVRVVQDIATKLPPDAALRMLLYFRRWWYHYPRRRYDFDSWYGVVSTLIRQVSRSPEQTEQWRDRFPHLLCAASISRTDAASRNRRRQALDWLSNQRQKYRLVQDGFARLGYISLETACEADQGFSVDRPPTCKEKRLIDLLEAFVEETFPGWFGTSLPPCRVLTHDQAVWMGMAVCLPSQNLKRNPQGWVIRYELTLVALKPGLFRAEAGAEVMSTYLHELSHTFGGDQSAAFSQALTGLLEVLVEHPEALLKFRKNWRAACKSDALT